MASDDVLQVSSTAIEQAVVKGSSKILASMVPGLAQDMKDAIQPAIDKLVTDSGQQVQNDVDTTFEVSNTRSNAQIRIRIQLGPIQGSYQSEVTGSRKVADHTRSYQDARPWEFSDGHWETLNHIPAELALEAGLAALGYE